MVSILAIRCLAPSLGLYRQTRWALLAGYALLSVTFARTLLDLLGLSAQQLGVGVYVLLQSLLGLGISSLLIPLKAQVWAPQTARRG